MSEPYYILSPCGTSLLTNAASNDERKLVSKHANCPTEDDIPNEDAHLLSGLIDRVREEMMTANQLHAAKMSAELNAITKLYSGAKGHSQDFHQLLCTDTWLGETTAQVVADWLKKEGFKTVDVKRQQDLQTADLQALQLALSDLVQWCDENLPGYRQQKSQYRTKISY